MEFSTWRKLLAVCAGIFFGLVTAGIIYAIIREILR